MRTMLAAVLLIISPMILHAAPAYEEDQHYFPVIPEQPGGEGGKVQVKGFFWYGCGHCYTFEPHLEKWNAQRPDNVEFERVPAMFSRSDVVMHAKTYYALNLIGAEEKIHEKIFQAMHAEKRRLRTQEEMEEFLSENDIDVDAFRKAMKSFAVQTKIRQAAIHAENYDVRGVPSVTVDGEYKVGSLKGGTMIDVVEYLVDDVRKKKSSKPSE